MRLQQSVGNRAVAQLVQRQPTTTPAKPPGTAGKTVAPPSKTPAPRNAEKLSLALSSDPDDAIVFQTQKGKLGALEVYCTGRLSVYGDAAFDGEQIPADADLPKDRSKHPSVSLWTAQHARDVATRTLNAVTPTGSDQEIVVNIGGQSLVLDLARGFEGLPPFGVAGEFHVSPHDLAFGSLKIPHPKVRLDATVWITPGPAAPLAQPAPAADDNAVMAYSFAGGNANFNDRHTDQTHTTRTGAITLWSSVNRLENELHEDVRNHPALKNREQKVALLQEMRPFFGSDDRTIEHFKRIRRVFLHSASKKSNLFMHDEAATRLEAVRDELPDGWMPDSTIGWPRAAHSLGAIGSIGNLHNLGMAVDFNATEMPHLSSALDLDLVRLVTGGVHLEVPEMWTRRQGAYDEMIKRTAERGAMADPDPASDEGKFLAKTVQAAQDASDRSERFKHSLDVTDKDGAVILDGQAEMARLKESYLTAKASKVDWSDADRQAFNRLVKPWADTVDKELANAGKAAETAGFKLQGLATGKALTDEQTALTAAVAAGTKLRKAIKNDTPSEKQSTDLAALLPKLRQLLRRDPPAPDAQPDTAAILAELDALLAAAAVRLKGYGKAVWYNRVADLRHGLDSPDWVLGTSRQLEVTDPSPAQMVQHGFFNLREHSHDAAESVTIDFIKAMVKHGFLMLGAWDTPDFMHFELRWQGPGTRR
jgi:hypothetical protein